MKMSPHWSNWSRTASLRSDMAKTRIISDYKTESSCWMASKKLLSASKSLMLNWLTWIFNATLSKVRTSEQIKQRRSRFVSSSEVGQHLSQNNLPHRLQWWRRTNKLKSRWQIIHTFDSLSSIQSERSTKFGWGNGIDKELSRPFAKM
jgi:hypothetical protein